MLSTNSLSESAYSSVSSILDDCSALLNEAPSMTEMTTIILCACMPTLPKSIRLFKRNYKRASTNQRSHSTDTDFKKSRGGGVIFRNLTSTGSSWPESDDYEMQVVGDYHLLEEEQVTKPRPLSKIDSFINSPCWGEQVQVGMVQKDLRTMPSGRLFTLRIRRIPRERVDRIQALPGRFRLSVLFELIFSVSIFFFGTKSI